MKILVFSDSHRNTRKMIEAIKDHLPSCNVIIHLGDGVRDVEHVSSLYPEIPLVSLKGNGESFSRDSRILDIEGLRIMCIHGHTYDVKMGIDRAAMCAIDNDVDILLYGHTHTPDDSVYTSPDGRQVRVFNPGSIGMGYPSSYGLIDIPRKGSYVTSHAFL